jgi:hypothetical protein
LANCNGHLAKANNSRPRSLTPSALFTAPTAREVRVVKPSHKDRVLTGPHGPFNYPNL